MPDDWELIKMGTTTNAPDGDWDRDGFPNYSEWIASTDPNAPGSYIGWETLYKAGSGMSLTFQAVTNRTYHIEGNDDDLPDPAGWRHLATVHSGGQTHVEWTDEAYPTNASRHYRIKIPAFVP